MALINRRGFLERTVIAGAGLTTGNCLSRDSFASATAMSSGSTQRPADREWTFEEAKKLWKPMTRAVQHVGVPGYGWQAGVLWDGSLLFGPLNEFRATPAMAKECAPLGRNLLNVAIGYGDPVRFQERSGIEDAKFQRGLEDGRLPLPHVSTHDGELLWVETVFAHLLDRNLEDGMSPSPDDVLVVQARFNVRNSGTAPSARPSLAALWRNHRHYFWIQGRPR